MNDSARRHTEFSSRNNIQKSGLSLLQDYAFANDAAAEEDYSETQQNTDTEAASSDTEEERFQEMHDQHSAGTSSLQC